MLHPAAETQVKTAVGGVRARGSGRPGDCACCTTPRRGPEKPSEDHKDACPLTRQSYLPEFACRGTCTHTTRPERHRLWPRKTVNKPRAHQSETG